MTTTDVPPTQALALRPIASTALTIQDIIAQKKLVAQCVSELMHENEHYGVIPGTEKTDKEGRDISKRTLLKAGADLLCSLFQLEADYQELEVIRSPTLIYYRLKCTLTSAQSGIRRGSGVGSCNSHEEKYLRAAPKKCPQCGKEAIKRSKFPPRNDPKAEPGWYCFDKIGGCGAQFEAAAAAIAEQEAGIKDPADLDNTILKMAAKRSRVDAVLTVTGASDFFTQDVADLESSEVTYTPPPQKAGADPKAQAPTPAATPQTTSATTTTSAGTASKKLKAGDIKHDGTMATPAQVQLLHVLKGKLGMPECDGKCAEEYKQWQKKAKGLVDKVRRCDYHAQLSQYLDCDGRAIESSKDLSERQISHLLDRYQAKLATKVVSDANKQATAEKGLDLGALIPPADELAALRKELAATKFDKMIIRELVFDVMGVDDGIQIDTPAAAYDALQLLLSIGTPQYGAVKEAITRAPQ